MPSLNFQTLIIAQGSLVLALTILVAVLWKFYKKPELLNWFYSDIFALFSILTYHSILMEQFSFLNIIFFFSTWMTFHLRVLSVCSPNFIKPFNRFAFSVLALLLVSNIFFQAIPIQLHVFFNSSAFALLCCVFAFVSFRAHHFRNFFGRFLIFSSSLGVAFLGFFRAIRAITIDPSLIFGEGPFTTISSVAIMSLGVISHCGFIIVVLDELTRAESDSVHALEREAELRRNAEEREQESLKIADEQRRLIEVLTHEVRQPLNNASAALQSIGNELGNHDSHHEIRAIASAQSVIDSVAIALSNALVAATILERRQQFNPIRCEPMLLVDMGVLDFNKDDRARIRIDAFAPPLYVTVDPVLFRIALRNLVENALHYSPPGSIVSLDVIENETEMGSEFRVENFEPDPDVFTGVNIFERRVRGRSADTTGSGMGLYISSEIAKLHQGWVRSHHQDGRRVFTLFLPD